MSDSEKKMNILIEEANANYNANRYKDAARTFEHLITLAIQNNEETGENIVGINLFHKK